MPDDVPGETTESWGRLEQLFHQALQVPEVDRSAFLEQHCGQEPRLRRKLEAMLLASDRDTGRLDAAVSLGANLMLQGGEGFSIPQRLGPYRILREIGRGGLSTVYLAQRDDQQFDMQVAVKVVRPGMHTEDILRRLRRERQILAALEHPYIARLHDGGTTSDGLPYFVMEHIEGEPIDSYCRRRRLDLAERIGLFHRVCEAVDYAHRNLVLHRDIKPSNLLVTADGSPKLLDFGIAKLLEPQPHEEPNTNESVLATPGLTRTRTGQRLLTPEFASPEQIEGGALSTASDVYSLGMLLYLLLTGEPAYRFTSPRASEIEKVICERVPERPSSRLAGNEDAVGLRSQHLRGDLDKVVLMALAKEPDRRYRSAGELAADLDRWQRKLPVAARSDTLLYRSRKFLHRHRLAVSMVAGLVLVLLLAVVFSSRQARLAREALARAEAANRMRATQAGFLTELLESPDPWKTGGSVTVREVLESGARRIRWQLADDPALRATLLATMGQAFLSLNVHPRATELFEEALELRRKIGDELSIAVSLRDLASLRFELGELEEAERLLEQSLAIQTERLGDDSDEVATTLYDMAAVSAAAGRSDDAERQVTRALELRLAQPGVEHQDLAEVRNRLGEILYSQGRYPQAEALFEKAVADSRHLGPHPMLALSLNNLAAARQVGGDRQSAARLLEEALELRIELLGEVHSQVAQGLNNLAMLELDLGQKDEAEQRMLRALEIYRDLFGEEHPSVVDSLHNLGFLHQTRGDLERAGQIFRQAIELGERLPGDHQAALLVKMSLAKLAAQRGDADAEALYLEILAQQRLMFPAADRRLAKTLGELGQLLLQGGEPSRAEPLLAEALQIRLQHSPKHWTTARAQARLGECLLQLGRLGRAESLLRSSLEGYTQSLGEEHEVTRKAAGRLTDVQRRLGAKP